MFWMSNIEFIGINVEYQISKWKYYTEFELTEFDIHYS